MNGDGPGPSWMAAAALALLFLRVEARREERREESGVLERPVDGV